MRILNKITRSLKDAYWDAVQDCLTEIHKLPAADARGLCSDRRAEVEFAPPSVRSNVFYHREPFDVARDLVTRRHAGSPGQHPGLSDPKTGAQYEAILVRRGLS